MLFFLVIIALASGQGTWQRSWSRTWNTQSQPSSQTNSWSKSSKQTSNTKSNILSTNGGCTGPECTTCNNGNCDTPIQTCPSCITTCSNQCSSDGQCLRGCLNHCNCEHPEPEQTEETPCCQVLHPRTCFDDEFGNKRCVMRRHKECSDTCTSPVVSIQQGGNTRGCHYIRNYPYVYCGNYERHSKIN